MKRILIPLCLVVGSHAATGQRSHQFESPERLFVEGKEMFVLRNYPGCTDKLEAFKKQSALTQNGLPVKPVPVVMVFEEAGVA